MDATCLLASGERSLMPKHRAYRWIAVIVGVALLVIVLALASLTGPTAK